jgi:hypothetical protein
MTAANDWTSEMMTKGYPQLQQLYRLFGRPDHVRCHSLLHFPHNYNYVTRALMYSWFNKHLQLGLAEPIVEEHWEPLTPEEWTVWVEKHRAPQHDPDYEVNLTRWLASASDEQMAELVPADRESLREFRKIVGGGFATLVGRDVPVPGSIERLKVDKQEQSEYLFFKDIVTLPEQGEVLPVVSFYPVSKAWNKHVVIWVDGSGKAGVFDAEQKPIRAIQDLLSDGFSVVSADLLFQGEFLADRPMEETRVVKNPRQFAGFTFGYNHTLFAQRVHDILTLISYVRHNEHEPLHVHLVGVAGAGPLVAAASGHAADAVSRTIVDTRGFRFAGLRSYRDPSFWPGAVKYGDLPALLALSAPRPLWIAGEKGVVPPIVRASYQSAGAQDAVHSSDAEGESALRQAVRWLAGAAR